MSAPSDHDINDMLKPVLLKDLRTECRARGLNPGGSKEALGQRVKEDMIASGNFSLGQEHDNSSRPAAAAPEPVIAPAHNANNYHRSNGQNVGNFITDRSSSHVMAPPGGYSSINLSGEGFQAAPPARATGRQQAPTPVQAPSQQVQQAQHFQPPQQPSSPVRSPTSGINNNNYARPGGQNVGNFMTDRSSSRVLAPPGGSSQITFG